MPRRGRRGGTIVVVGVGVDLVEVARVKAILERFGERFAERVLSVEEQEEWQERRELGGEEAARWLAKRFAAKEAFAKAWGSGLGREVGLHDVWVRHGAGGRPLLSLSLRLQRRLRRAGVGRVHVSLSDERAYAVAIVVLEGESGRGLRRSR
ncbi:MAG: holo-ACP synthase [Hydrogenophilus sp.]|nr:holo-ACP synthase [Hydrogenophilus sp.]